MECVNRIFDFLVNEETLLLTEFAKILIPCSNPSMFTIKKNFRLVETVQKTHGKWGDVLGNAFFIESDHLVLNLALMSHRSLYEYWREDGNFNTESVFAGLKQMILSKVEGKYPTSKISKYSLAVIGKIDDRQTDYMKGAKNSFEGGVYRIRRRINRFIQYLDGTFDLDVISPTGNSLEKNSFVDFQVSTLLFSIAFFIFMIDSIVIYSQMISDVE